MAVRLVFLGKLADLAGAPEREIEAPLDWGSLVEALEGDLGRALEGGKVKLAVNGAVLADKTAPLSASLTLSPRAASPSGPGSAATKPCQSSGAGTSFSGAPARSASLPRKTIFTGMP